MPTIVVPRPLGTWAADGGTLQWRHLLVEPERFSREREALLRIATLAFDSTDQRGMFDAVAAGAVAWSGAGSATLLRCGGEGDHTVVGSYAGPLPVGTRIAAGGQDDGVIAAMLRFLSADPRGGHGERIEPRLPEVHVGPGGLGIAIVIDDRLWGVLAVTTGGSTLGPTAVHRLRQFASLVRSPLAHANTRAELEVLVDERAFLRRIHAVAGRGGTGADVLAAIAAEGSAWLDGLSSALVRVEEDGRSTVVATSDRAGAPADDERDQLDQLIERVLRSGTATRIDAAAPGPEHERGTSPAVGVPITVAGRIWGVFLATSPSGAMPPDAEHRLARFGEAITPTILSAQARTQLAREQFALRRVAELVARGAGADDVFAVVVRQASEFAGGADVVVTHWETTELLRVVAAHGATVQPVGTLLTVDGQPLPVEATSDGRAADQDQPPAARPTAVRHHRQSVVAPISVGDEPWGLLSVSSTTGSLPVGTQHLVTQFADLAGAELANARERARIQELADEQAALRRVAELAARDAPIEQVLDAVAIEAAAVADVEFSGLLRYNADGSTEIVALHGAPAGFHVGMRAPNDGDGAVLSVLHSGRHARVDNLASVRGSWPETASRFGLTSGVGVPISIQGELWGSLVAARRREMSARTEEQLSRFAELASIAISSAQSRRAVRMLAETQAALSRVAALVARGAALAEVFSAVATEASHQVEDGAAVLVGLDSDNSFAVVGAANSDVPAGFRGRPSDGALLAELVRTGVRAPFERGRLSPEPAHRMGIDPTVAVPITVEGRLWGALTISSAQRPVPDDLDQRLLEYADLAGAAIANAENKAKLTASRARVVAAADEARRRLQRDVHDSAQQRLVHTILTLKLAQQAIAAGRPPDDLVEEALLNAERASNELRDIVRGILPAALTRGGLRLGLESLVSDLALPVDLSVTAPRCSTDAEQTAYLIVAEALTNVIKHANAERAAVSIALDAGTLTIEVHDDGVGGADPARGTGLLGLADRVEAVEGVLTLTSPPGVGTTVQVRLPVRVPPAAQG
jgi:signal transduction histidine kinase